MSRFAIVESGSCQYWVKENDLIHVEKLKAGKGEEVSLERVLLVERDGETRIGSPLVSGAKVLCEMVGDERQPKVINYKYRRRKNSRRKKGHRQTLLVLRVKAIEV